MLINKKSIEKIAFRGAYYSMHINIIQLINRLLNYATNIQLFIHQKNRNNNILSTKQITKQKEKT